MYQTVLQCVNLSTELQLLQAISAYATHSLMCLLLFYHYSSKALGVWYTLRRGACSSPLAWLTTHFLALQYNLTVYVCTECSGQGVGPVASAATVMARLLHLFHLLPPDPVRGTHRLGSLQ